MIQHKAIQVCALDFTFSVEVSERAPVDLRLTSEPVPHLPQTYLVRLRIEGKTGEAFALDDLSIEWSVPAIDMHGLYAGPPSPDELAKLPFWQFQKQSAANTG